MRTPYNSPRHNGDFELFLSHWPSEIPDVLQPFLHKVDGKRILDLGCGHGSQVIAALIAHGVHAQYVHLDLDLIALSRSDWTAAEQNYHYRRGMLVCADAYTLPFADATFDLVNIPGLAVDNPELNEERLSAEVARILQPGGFTLNWGYDVGFAEGHRIDESFPYTLWRKRDRLTHMIITEYPDTKARLVRYLNEMRIHHTIVTPQEALTNAHTIQPSMIQCDGLNGRWQPLYDRFHARWPDIQFVLHTDDAQERAAGNQQDLAAFAQGGESNLMELLFTIQESYRQALRR